MALSEYIKLVCKIGQGGACCKYLVAGPKGFECMKVVPADKALIDRNWATTGHVAQGDNCDGQTDLSKPQNNAHGNEHIKEEGTGKEGAGEKY